MHLTIYISDETLSSEKHTISITKAWLALDIETYSSAYFKPSIPYTGKVRILNIAA